MSSMVYVVIMAVAFVAFVCLATILFVTKKKEQEEYDRLISWAEIYSVCPFGTKKMFISQFVKSVRVYRDYELEIEFNVSFEEFRDLRVRE